MLAETSSFTKAISKIEYTDSLASVKGMSLTTYMIIINANTAFLYV